MPRRPNDQTQEYFVIPERTLRGSPREMLAEIDLTVAGLLALRGAIAGRNLDGPPAHVRHTSRARLRHFISALASLARPRLRVDVQPR